MPTYDERFLQGYTETATMLPAGGGLLITGNTDDKVGYHGVTPTDQAAATSSAYAAMVEKGLIASGGNDYSLLKASISLTAAQIIAMYTTSVLLVAAVTSRSIAVHKVIFTITRTATAFTGGGVGIVQYASTANGAGLQACDSTIAAAVITGAEGVAVCTRNGAVISDSAAVRGVGLYIGNQTAVFAAGTGTATVDVWYTVSV